MYSVSGSIVLYNNNAEIVRRVIACFLNIKLPIKLCIVDNSGNDLKYVFPKDDRIEYIFNGKNVGFGSGHNIAIKRLLGRSKYHLILNPDISFEDGVVEKLYAFMEANNDIGLVMPRVRYFDGSDQFLCKLLPSPVDLIRRRLNLNILENSFRNSRDKYELRFTGYDKIMDVPHLSGCFMFIRNEVFSKVGFFDEKFFMYLEDVDFSRRIHKRYRTVYYPEVTVYHEHERGSYKNLTHLKYHVISAIKYFNKWGWFFDREKQQINNKALKRLKQVL